MEKQQECTSETKKYSKTLEYLEKVLEKTTLNDIENHCGMYAQPKLNLLMMLEEMRRNCENEELLLNLFDFEIAPEQHSQKIHIVSLFLGMKLPWRTIPWRRTKELIPLLPKLNETFKGLLFFEANGNSMLQVTRTWKQHQTTSLWYTG